MIKYAKIIDETKGLCEIGLGTDERFFESLGMSKMDVAQSDIDGEWYLAEKLKTNEYLLQKSEHEKTKRIEEIKRELIELDIKTIRAVREGGEDDNGRPFIDVYQEQINALREELAPLENN